MKKDNYELRKAFVDRVVLWGKMMTRVNDPIDLFDALKTLELRIGKRVPVDNVQFELALHDYAKWNKIESLMCELFDNIGLSEYILSNQERIV